MNAQILLNNSYARLKNNSVCTNGSSMRPNDLSHKSTVSAGVAILFSKSFLPISFDLQEIVKGRLIKVVAKYDKSALVLLNVQVVKLCLNRHFNCRRGF